MSAATDLLNVPSRPIKQKIKLKVGRKTSYTPQAADAFCRGIASGLSMSDVCQKDGVPSVSQAFEWMRKYPEFAEAYTRACEERGMLFGHKLTDLASAVLSGEVDPAAARVAGDFYKFTAARLASKTWGEKSQLTVEHSISQQAVEVLQELTQRQKQRRLDAQIIDVTPAHSLVKGEDAKQYQRVTVERTDTAPIGASAAPGSEPPAPATTDGPPLLEQPPSTSARL